MEPVMKVIHVNIISDEEPAPKRRKRNNVGVFYAGPLQNYYASQEFNKCLTECAFCKRSVPEHEFQAHSITCSRRPVGLSMYPCEICRQPFDRRSQKETHFREFHPRTPLLVCSACGRTFVRTDEFNSHSGNCELSQLSYLCGACGVKFTTPLAFEQHAIKNHKLPQKRTPTSHSPDSLTKRHIGTSRPQQAIAGEEAVVLKKTVRRFVIAKMPASEVNEACKRITRKRPTTRERLKKSSWPYPTSPLPDVKPLLPEDFDTPSTLKVVPHRRSIFRVNSLLQVSAPDVIEMLQPSGNLLMDSDFSESTGEFTLDETNGVLITKTGRRLMVESDPSDFQPFTDEIAGREYYKSLYEQFLKRMDNADDGSAVPIIIGSGAEAECKQFISVQNSSSPEIQPPLPPAKASSRGGKKRRMLKNQIDGTKGKSKVSPMEQNQFILGQNSEYLVQESSTYQFNMQGDGFALDNQYSVSSEEQERISLECGTKPRDFAEENVEQEDYHDAGLTDMPSGDLSLVQEEELPEGLQVFSDEEGRLIIVQPNGVTSVAPPGSQVVQIDTGEIFVLQPTEDGNTVAVPLSGDTESTSEESHEDTTDGVAAVFNEDGSVSFLLEDGGCVQRKRTIESA